MVKGIFIFLSSKGGKNSLLMYIALSSNMRFPTMWYVQPAKTQISLRICTVWLETIARCLNILFGVSKIKRRLHRLVWVYTYQNDALLEIKCRSSNNQSPLQLLMIWIKNWSKSIDGAGQEEFSSKILGYRFFVRLVGRSDPWNKKWWVIFWNDGHMHIKLTTGLGVHWLSGRLLDLRQRGRGFNPPEPLHCGPWAGHIILA